MLNNSNVEIMLQLNVQEQTMLRCQLINNYLSLDRFQLNHEYIEENMTMYLLARRHKQIVRELNKEKLDQIVSSSQSKIYVRVNLFFHQLETV